MVNGFAGDLGFGDGGDARLVQPVESGRGRGDKLGRGRLEGSEKGEDAGAFQTAEAGGLHFARAFGAQGQRVILGAPDGSAVRDGDLGFQQAIDAPV